MSKPVVIVGAGLSGLNCARLLWDAGIEVLVLERDDGIGGRVRTDVVEGFRLDRGFQVLLTAYAEAQRSLDFDALNLRSFAAGSLVHVNGRFHKMSDPFREPGGVLSSLTSPVGSVRDKLKVLRLRNAVRSWQESELMQRPATTVVDALSTTWGFSPSMIERFFRPFIGGIMLDASLLGSSRMFEYVFKMFSEGHAAVPSEGMDRIPAQLAAKLPADTVRTGVEVAEVRHHEVITEDGQSIPASTVVVAAAGPAADKLLRTKVSPSYVDTFCHYFAAEKPPVDDPILILNGEGIGPVNNIAIMTNVSPDYSSTDNALVSVTSLSNTPSPSEAADVQEQLIEWFGPVAAVWRHLQSYHIREALPDQRLPFLDPPEKPVRVAEHVYRCGDYLDTASINGALRSGRRAAEAVREDLA